MKRKSAKIIIWSIFLILLKFVPRFDLVIEQSYWVLSAAFIVSAILLLVIPNRVVGIIITALITVATSVYQFDYFLYALPVLALIYAHKELSLLQGQIILTADVKKSKKEKNAQVPFSQRLSYVGCGIGLACTAAQYLFVSKPGFGFEIKDTIFDMRYAFIYALIIITMFCVALKTDTSKKDTSLQIDMRTQYMVFCVISLICLGASIGSSYLLSENGRVYDDVQLNYWFVFVVALVVNKDYYIGVLSNNLKEFVEKR